MVGTRMMELVTKMGKPLCAHSLGVGRKQEGCACGAQGHRQHTVQTADMGGMP